MRSQERMVAGVAFAVLSAVAAPGHAAVSSASQSKVSFKAAATGMPIEGTTSSLNVQEQTGNIVITVALASLTTGISLRDSHMRDKYLEVQKYPNAVLTVARTALQLPAAGAQSHGDSPATIQIHGQTKPCTVHYDTTADAAGYSVKGTVHVNMNDHGINVPSYLGVTVKPDVDITAAFRVEGT
jgi:polyisoprenoid-binding protein YceI